VQAEYSLDYDYDLHRPLTRSASKRVRVGSGEMDPVEIRLAPPFSLEVTMDWGDSDDPGAVHPDAAHPIVRFTVDPMDRQQIPYRVWTGDTQRGDLLRIEGLFPGRYHFPSALQAQGYYLQAMLLDGRNVVGREMVLSGGGSLKVVFRKGGGTVRGRVENGRGALVRLMDDSGRTYSASCTGDGDFAISDVPPGEYRVRAYPQAAGVDGNSDLASGEPVKVEAGATVNLELKIAR
jgi:hypothetical protein